MAQEITGRRDSFCDSPSESLLSTEAISTMSWSNERHVRTHRTCIVPSLKGSGYRRGLRFQLEKPIPKNLQLQQTESITR